MQWIPSPLGTQVVKWETRWVTHFQEARVLSFFDAFIDEVQRLLQVLAVNGVLNLFIAPLEHDVVG